jgi:hypothetical protein
MSYAVLKVPSENYEIAQRIATRLHGEELGVDWIIVIPLASELLTGKLAEDAVTTLHQTIHRILGEEKP